MNGSALLLAIVAVLLLVATGCVTPDGSCNPNAPLAHWIECKAP